MSKGKRTGIDFSNHELLIKEYDGILIHHLKQPNTIVNNIMYINAGGVLSVTGDFGNWIFCREFHPSANTEYISDGYWCEKLEILSTQVPTEYSSECTLSCLKERMNEDPDNLTDEEKEYYEECMSLVEDKFDYEYYAFRSMPSGWDYEDVVFCKETKIWLKAVFDGFEEICSRLKFEESKA